MSISIEYRYFVIYFNHQITGCEEEITQAGTRKLNYISSPYGLVGIYIDDGVSPQMYYVLTDHLGSIRALTDGNGQIAEEYSFDSWGRRRDAQTGEYVSTFSGLTDRGYTGHEHLDEFGLINMNGRMYDPVLGRMLSPDNYVQDATGTQNYNRYSYCLNNPISYVDPDGNNPLIAIMIFSAFTNVAMNSDNINNFWDGLGYAAVGAASGTAGYGAGAGVAGMFATGSSGFIVGAAAGVAGGAAGGFTGGFGNTLVGDGSFADALNNGFKQGVFGALEGGVVGGVVSGVEAEVRGKDFLTGGDKAKVYKSPVRDNLGDPTTGGDCVLRCTEEFSKSFGYDEYNYKYWLKQNGYKHSVHPSDMKNLIDNSGFFASEQISGDVNSLIDAISNNKRVLVGFNTKAEKLHAVMVSKVKMWPNGNYRIWFAETSPLRIAPYSLFNSTDPLGLGSRYWTFFLRK